MSKTYDINVVGLRALEAQRHLLRRTEAAAFSVWTGFRLRIPVAAHKAKLESFVSLISNTQAMCPYCVALMIFGTS